MQMADFREILKNNPDSELLQDLVTKILDKRTEINTNYMKMGYLLYELHSKMEQLDPKYVTYSIKRLFADIDYQWSTITDLRSEIDQIDPIDESLPF
jgi:hypothetical protein